MGDFIENNKVISTPHIFGCSLRNISVSASSTSGSLASITIEVVQEPGQTFSLLEINPTLLSLQTFNLQFEALNIEGVVKGYDFSEIDMNGTGVFSVYLEEVPTSNAFINVLLPNTEELISIHSENEEILTLRRGYSIIEGVTEFHRVTDDSLFLLVAGLPQTNVKRAVQINDDISKTEDGVNQIMTQFDVNGIKTRYSKSFKPNSGDAKLDEIEKDVDDLTELQELERNYEWERPTGGLGEITSKSGPLYDIRRINTIDTDPVAAIKLGIPLTTLFPEWLNVRNLAEPFNSPGYLSIGTRVNVNIYNEDGHHVPYIEVSPQVFAPPI